jgi:hypothetical protein
LILDGDSIAADSLVFASEAVVYTAAKNGTITTPITTGGGLTKFGPGRLTLANTAANTVGAVTVNGGTLALTGATNASGAVAVNNGATLAGTGSIATAGTNGVAFGPKATFAPGFARANVVGNNYGGLTVTTASGNVTTASPTTNPTSLTSAGLTFGLGISPTNVVGSVISLNLGAPAATGGLNTGLSNANTLGNRASGCLVNSSGGTLTLDPITTVTVDADPANLVAGSSYSYLVGTVPTGSTGGVSDFGSFTFANAGAGFTDSLNSASLLVANGGAYLNFTVAPVPEPTTTGLIAAAGLARGAYVRRRISRGRAVVSRPPPRSAATGRGTLRPCSPGVSGATTSTCTTATARLILPPEPASVMTRPPVRRAALALVAALATAHPAAAQYVWTGASSTGWNDPNNWNNGGNPGVPVSSATTAVTLAGTVRTVTTLNIPGGLTLNTLVMDSSATNGFTVNGGQLTFAGTGATLQFNGTNSTTVSSALILNAAINFSADTTINIVSVTGNAVPYDVVLGGALTGSATVTKSGNAFGDVAITGANNTFAGTWVNAAGFTYLAAPNALGRAATASNTASTPGGFSTDITASATEGTQAAAYSQQLGRLIGTGTGSYQIGGAATVATTLTGFLNGTDSYAGSVQANNFSSQFAKVGTGTLTITGASTSFLGVLSVRDGSLVLQGGSGRLTNGGSTVGGGQVLAGATLWLNNAGVATANQGDRLQDNGTFTLSGGTLQIDGNSNSSVTSSETIGALRVGPGQATIQLNPGGTRGVQLNVLSGTISQTDPTGTVFFRGATLGAAAFAAGANATANVAVGVPPALVGGGGSTATQQSILPYGLGLAAASGDPNTFVTYDTTRGTIRPLDPATEFATTLGANAADNVLLSANPAAVASATSANSLILSGGRTVTLNAPLTVTAGALLQVGSGASTVSGSGGSLLFGTLGGSAALVTAAGPADAVTLSVPVTAAHFSKNGLGTVTLTAPVSLGSSGSVVAVNLGTLVVQNNGTTTTGGFTTSNGLITYQVSKGVVPAGGSAGPTLDVSGVTGGLVLGTGQVLTGGGAGFAATPTPGQPANGTVAGTVTVNAGGTVTPSGLPGPGTLVVGSMVWKPNGTYNWQVSSAVTDAGFVSPYTAARLVSPTGTLDLTNLTTSSRFIIKVTSLGPNNATGTVYDFDPSKLTTWTIATFGSGATGGITNPTGGFSPNLFTVDTSGFGNLAGTNLFSVIEPDSHTLQLVFTPVPESGAVLGLAGLALALWRRRPGRG